MRYTSDNALKQAFKHVKRIKLYIVRKNGMSPHRRHPLFLLKKIGKIYRELLTFDVSRDIIKTVKEEQNTPRI